MRVFATVRALREAARKSLERAEVEAAAEEARLIYFEHAQENDASLAFIRLRLSFIRLGREIVS